MRVIRAFSTALAWAVGVTAVATVAWVAIDSAGRQVVDRAIVAADSAPSSGGLAVGPASGPATRSAAPTGTGTATGTGTPTSTSALGPAATPTRTSTPSTTSQTSPSTGPPGRNTPPPPPPPSATPRVGVQFTQGGAVELECTGTRPTGYNAAPNDGWSTRLTEPVAGVLDVDFHRGDTEVSVKGSCVAGVPTFEVRTHRDGRDDDHDD